MTPRRIRAFLCLTPGRDAEEEEVEDADHDEHVSVDYLPPPQLRRARQEAAR